MKPVVAIYSTFLQRAYDQLIHDVVLQNLPVVFAIDRGGIVGADGPTHNGSFDLTYLRCLPNMTVMTPADENECRMMLYYRVFTGHAGGGALPARRGPRRRPSNATSDRCRSARASCAAIRSGVAIAILAFGSLLHPALVAAEEIDATVANMRFVKPLDTEMIAYLARTHEALVTVEENVVAGGAGSAVAEALAAQGFVGAHTAPRAAGRIRRSRRSGAAARAVRTRRERLGGIDSRPLRLAARRHHATTSAEVVKIAKPAA